LTRSPPLGMGRALRLGKSDYPNNGWCLLYTEGNKPQYTVAGYQVLQSQETHKWICLATSGDCRSGRSLHCTTPIFSRCIGMVRSAFNIGHDANGNLDDDQLGSCS